MTEQDTRTLILDTAERHIADHGLAGARVAAIAEEAGVNKAMLYYYFKSKRRLHQAVIERVFDQVVGRAQQLTAHPGAPASEALVSFQRAYAQILAEHPSMVRILMRSLLDHPEETAQIMAPKLGAVLPLMTAQVLRGQQEGHINPALHAPLVLPSLVAPVVFFGLTGPLLASLTGAPLEQLQALWLQNTQALLLHGLAVPPSEAP